MCGVAIPQTVAERFQGMKAMLAIVLAALVVSAAYAADGHDTKQVLDRRQSIDLTAHDRVHLLVEMRAMLEGTQLIVQGLADNDMKLVANAAREIGMGMARKVEDSLKQSLPPEFIQLGTATHADFDRIAVIAEKGGGAKQAARQLSTTLNRCVACHETFQVRVPPSPVTKDDARHEPGRPY